MAQIPTAPYGLPFRAVKGPHIGEIESLIRPQRAAAQLGESIASFGAKMAEQALERNANREFAEFKGFVNEQMSQMRDFANSNPDFNEYQGQWTQGHVKNIEQRLEGMSRRGREAAGNWWRMYGETYQSQVDTWVRDGMKRQAMISGFDELDRIPFRNYEVEAAAETARRRAANPKAPTVTEQEIQLAEATKILDSLSLGADPAILPYQRVAHLRLFKAKQEAAIEAAEMDAAFEKYSVMPYNEALEAVTKEKGWTEAQRNGVEARLANLERIRIEKKEAAQEATRDAINKAEYAGDYEQLYQLIETGIGGEGILPENEQKVLLRSMRNTIGGEDVKTDWDSYEKVYMAADALSNDQMTYPDVMKIFAELKPKISQTDRKTLLTKITSAKQTEANPVDQRIRKAVSELETAGGFIFSDDYLENHLSPEDWDAYESRDDEEKEKFKEAYSKLEEVKVLNAFDKWLADPNNANATPEDKENYLEGVLKPIKKEKAKGLLSRMWAAYWWTGYEKPAGYPDAKWDKNRKMWTVIRDGRIKEIKEGERKQWKKGDKRTIGGVTYTYDGEVWRD